jgi:transposase
VAVRGGGVSKLHRPAGDRVTTDPRDAVHLARLLRLDEIASVRIPSPAEEAARDLVRGREASRADLMRARHRLSKLLLRHGIVYSGGKAWTELHDQWLHQQHFDSIPTRAACALRPLERPVHRPCQEGRTTVGEEHRPGPSSRR